MLSSMDTVLDSSNDPNMVDKALKASATVTANSDQMPLNNQVRSFFNSCSFIVMMNCRKKERILLKKLEQKLKIWNQQMIILLLILRHVCIFLLFFFSFKRNCLLLALMNVGGNVLQAASKTVSKDKENDPGAIIEV